MAHQTYAVFHEKGLNPIAHIALLATDRSANSFAKRNAEPA
jgi:hypothetical protein